MKLVVGLGNPSARYQGTRHNVGYAVLADLASRFDAGRARRKFHAELIELRLGSECLLLLSPTTYMNRSGLSVAEAKGFYKLPERDLLILCDDLNLPCGKLRFRASGSSGGQKGLEDIILRLGTDQVPRLRIGIGPVPEGCDWVSFVLGRFTAEEAPQIEEAVRRAAQGVLDWAERGIEYCMNKYN